MIVYMYLIIDYEQIKGIILNIIMWALSWSEYNGMYDPFSRILRPWLIVMVNPSGLYLLLLSMHLK